MHRSRVSSIVIDCDDLPKNEAFWTQALGATVTWRDPEGVFVSLGRAAGGLTVLLQRVPEPKTCKSRMHIDFETDDLEAELQRLEALGARRVEQHAFWWIMADPCGNNFCVAKVHSDDFADNSNQWNS